MVEGIPKGWAIALSRTVATHEPSQKVSRPYGWVSTIAGSL